MNRRSLIPIIPCPPSASPLHHIAHTHNHTHTHPAYSLWYFSHLIVWTETMSPLLDSIHILPVRACLECVWECVCTCAQSESWSWADNTHPLLQGPKKSEEKETTAGPQWAKWTCGCQGAARQTKVASDRLISCYRAHLVDSVGWLLRNALPISCRWITLRQASNKVIL